MATLRAQLSGILPAILPADQVSAVTGSDLIEMVRPHLMGEYSDHSIRQTISAMAGDPESAIMKIERGQGYILRAGRRDRPDQRVSNIRRIDSNKSRGYQVHFAREGKLYTKLFSDSRYGSPSKSYVAALEHRNALVQEIGERKPYYTVAHSNTGEVGLTFTHMKRKSGRLVPYITAAAHPEPGKQVSRKFSIEQLGYDEALNQARAWRQGIITTRLEQERRDGKR